MRASPRESSGGTSRGPEQLSLFSDASRSGEARSIVPARGKPCASHPGRESPASSRRRGFAGLGRYRGLGALTCAVRSFCRWVLDPGAGRQSCPLANIALPPDRRGVFGRAYRQTVVRGEARFLAPGAGSRGPGFPVDRRAPRLPPRPGGGGPGLPAPQAFHQCASSGRRHRATKRAPKKATRSKGFHIRQWTRSGMTFACRL